MTTKSNDNSKWETRKKFFPFQWNILSFLFRMQSFEMLGWMGRQAVKQARRGGGAADIAI